MRNLFALAVLLIIVSSCNCFYKADNCGVQPMLMPNYSVAFYGFTREELNGTVFKSYETNSNFIHPIDSIVIDSASERLINEGNKYVFHEMYSSRNWKVEMPQYGSAYTIGNWRTRQVECKGCFGRKNYTREPDGFDVNGQHQYDYEVRINK